jgi:hypothetical protein
MYVEVVREYPMWGFATEPEIQSPHVAEKTVLASHFLVLKYDNVTGAGDLIFHIVS